MQLGAKGNSMKTYSHSGVVVDMTTGAPISGLRVEAWDTTAISDELIGHCVTDEDGAFSMDLTEDDVTALFGDRSPVVSFKVLQHVPGNAEGSLLASTTGTQVWSIRKTGARTKMRVDPSHGTSITAVGEFVVRGRVRDAAGIDLPSGLYVELVDKSFGGAEDYVFASSRWVPVSIARGPIASGEKDVDSLANFESGVDERGTFRISYSDSDILTRGKHRPDLVVRAVVDDPTSGLPIVLAESPVRYQAPPTAVVDLVIPNVAYGAQYIGRSEAAALWNSVSSRLGESTALLSSLTGDQSDQLAASAGVEPEKLAMLSAASRFNDNIQSIDREIFYGLIRQGCPDTQEKLLATPRGVLRIALGRAIEEGHVPADTDLDSSLDALGSAALSLAVQPHDAGTTCNLPDILALAIDDQGLRSDFISRFCSHEATETHGGAIEDFWANLSVEQPEVYTLELQAGIQLVLQLGGLTRYHLPLVRRLAGVSGLTMRQLAMRDESDWLVDLNAADQQVPPSPIGCPADVPGEDADEKLQNYAAVLTGTMAAAMPTAAIAGRVAKDEGIHTDLSKFFDWRKEFEFGKQRVASFLADPANLPTEVATGNIPALKARLERIERLCRLTKHYPHMKVLMEAGLDSSRSIARVGQDRFVAKFGETLGGSVSATQLYRKAEAVAASATMTYVGRSPKTNGRSLLCLPDQCTPLVSSDPVFADWEELFGSLDSIACPDCCSVYGPAAYLVDLLQFLGRYDSQRQKDPAHPSYGVWTAKEVLLGGRDETHTPASVLSGRRRDVANLDLSCKNTDTILPYIDLVNELLEYRLAERPLPDHIETSGETSELLSTREPVEPAYGEHHDAQRVAAKTLSESVYPFALPYSLYQHETRVYLGHLGVPRHELMSLLQADDRPTNLQIAQERLGMCATEREIVAGEPDDVHPWELWGFSDETPNSTSWHEYLRQAPAFLQASGLSYDELRELVETAFVARFAANPSSPPSIAPVQDTDGRELADLFIDGLVTGAEAIVAAWRQILRFIRLRNRLGCSITDLDKLLAAWTASINSDTLVELAEAERLRARLGARPVETAAWWGPVDAHEMPSVARKSLYEEVFLNKAVRNPVDQALAHALDDPPPVQFLSDHRDAILAAIRISASDYELLTGAGSPDQTLQLAPALSSTALSLENLSRLYRVASFARATRLSIRELRILQALSGLTPLLGDDPASTGRERPTETARFLEVIDRVRGSGFKAAELHYLLRHVSQPTAGVTAEELATDKRLADLDKGLGKIRADAASPSDPKGETLRATLTKLLAEHANDQDEVTADANTVMAIAAGQSALIASVQESEIDRILGPFVPDLTELKQALVVTPHELEGCLFWVEPAGLQFSENENPQYYHRVTSWTNLVSGGTNLSDVAGEQPLFVAGGGPNGLDAAQFDGAQRMFADSYAHGDSTFFCLLSQGALVAGRQILFDWGNEYLAYGTSTTESGSTLGFDVANGWVGAAPGQQGTQVVSWVLERQPAPSTSAACTIYRNGLQLGVAGDAARPWWPGACAIHLGGQEGDFFRGLISIAGFFSRALNADELVAVHGYLATKAGQPPAWRFEMVLQALLAFIRDRDATAFVTQTLSTALKLSTKSASNLITTWLHAFSDPTKGLIADFLLFPTTDAARHALIRLAKTATIIGRLGISDRELAWLCGDHRDPGWLDFNDLPIEFNPAEDLAVAQSRFTALMRLADLAALRRVFRAGPDSLVELFELTATVGVTVDNYREALCEKTGWAGADVDALAPVVGLYPSPQYPLGCRNEIALSRLATSMGALGRLGASASSALAWLDVDLPIETVDGEVPDAAQISAQILQTAKAKYSPEGWLDVARPLRNELRSAERDALVAHLTRTPTPDYPKYSDVDALYADLLIDVEMSPCQLTTRMKQATSAVQLFIQRCLLNIEPDVSLGQRAGREYSWMRSYRLWEANRKVFLYPENWIEPELRDDKTPEFKALESELRQGELTNEAVEDAYGHYLEKLDAISKLDVVGMIHERADETADDDAVDVLHVFGRTARGEPYTYYHRQWVDSSHWTPWQKVELDIPGNHLLPIVYGGRLLLFWPIIEKTADTDQDPGTQNDPGKKPEWRLDVKLSWSEYRHDRWLAPKTAKDAATLSSLDASRIALALEAGEAVGAEHNILLTRTDKTKERLFGRFAIGPCGSVEGGSATEAGSMVLRHPSYSSLLYQDYVPWPGKLALYVDMDLGGELHLSQLLSGNTQGPYHVHIERHRWPLTVNMPLHAIEEFFYRDKSRSYFAHLMGQPKAEWHLPSRAQAKFSAEVADSAFAVVDSEPTRTLKSWAKEPNNSIRATSVVAGGQWHFHPFYHPFACDLMGALFRSGVAGLLRWTDPPLQLKNNKASNLFSSSYGPSPSLVKTPYPVDEFDFSFSGAYSIYNWELFFHVPLLVAVRLSEDRRFEEARRWFHAIFDPTDTSNTAGPQRFWKVRPFFENMDLADIQADMLAEAPLSADAQVLKYKLGGGGDEDATVTLDQQIAVWRTNPFNPHLIARMRPLAYQKTTVMRYIDNLIDWADDLFRQDTMETINEATMLYVLAADLLGPRPTIIEPAGETAVMTYAELESQLDAFSNALVKLENTNPAINPPALPGPDAPPLPSLMVLYFGIPPNDKLLGFWDTVADRLFKIRHCMNIEGVVRELPLYEPPIDPGLLVQAAALGLDFGSVLSDIHAPAPFYRFSVLQQKAVDFTQGVISLGGSLLGALEKRDAEALSRLRAGQESALLDLVRDTRKAQIDQANEDLAALLETQKVVQMRWEHYRDIAYMNPNETQSLAKTGEASTMQAVGQGLQVTAGLMYLIPNFGLGIAGAMGTPLSSASIGGDPIGKSTEAIAQIMSILAGVLRDEAQRLGTLGGYDRRWEDWKLQERLAAQELKQLDRQVLAARIRIAIAQSELASHEKQIESAKEVEAYLRDKFTNDELYDWMASELSAVYFQSYKLAYDMARRAEKAYQFERGERDASFVSFGYWDSRRKGLCAGEKLALDLRRMEAAYLEKNRREYEITKHVSLAEQFPLNLLELRATGSTEISLPESLFDLDYPGHYMRRLKSVSLTIPAVTGPHTSVNCTLTLLESSIRTSATAGPEYTEGQNADPLRFWHRPGATKAVCTSTGQNDAGMFELNFRDERLLPFEGEGAVGTWRVELPPATNRFDLASVTDVVLHLSYTAREGGAALGQAALTAALANTPPMAFRILGAREELSSEWNAFESELEEATHDQVLRFSLDGKLPFVPGSGSRRVTAIWLGTSWDGGGAVLPHVAVTPPEAQAALDFANVAPLPAVLVSLGQLTVPETGSWEIRVTQGTIAGLQSSQPPLIEPDPALAALNPVPFRIKPSALKDFYLVLKIERDPLPS